MIWVTLSAIVCTLPLISAKCPSLNLTNGHVSYNRPGINHGYPPNTIATFSCNNGYRVVGSESSTCLSSGEWMNKLPKCGGVCGTRQISNGHITYSTPPIAGKYIGGTTATVHCDWTYKLVGEPYICKKKSGRWSWRPRTVHWPVCAGVCPGITVSHGSATYTPGPVYGLFRTYTSASVQSCNQYYIPTEYRSSYTSSCQSDGTWSDTLSCQVSCAKLSLSHGRVHYTEHNYGNRYPVDTRAHHSCDDGYKREGWQTRKCKSTAAWSGSPTRCKKKKGCFPSLAKVKLENGKILAMSELQIGDKVQTVLSNGKVIYSEVITFLQSDPNMVSTYMSIITSSNKSLALSATHIVYARKYSSDAFNTVYGEQVSIGDKVLIQQNDKVIPQKVINIASFIMQGAFDPLTSEGNILVDGVLASCYASVDHNLAHFGMRPLQWFSDIILWIFGQDYIQPAYVMMVKEIGRRILPREQLMLN